MLLNFGGRKRSGAFDTVWPSAKALAFLEKLLCVNFCDKQKPVPFARVVSRKKSNCAHVDGTGYLLKFGRFLRSDGFLDMRSDVHMRGYDVSLTR